MTKKGVMSMRQKFHFLLIILGFILLLWGQPPRVASASARFVDNGDGTVTDTARNIMWQKGDNGKEVTFQQAQAYCRNLRLGGHTDWRLPNPDEGSIGVVRELMTYRHSPDVYANFDLFWSSDPTLLLPFNYRPSYGGTVLRAYPAKSGTRAFVRAVRSLVKNP
jgi:hypothetical protein